jgi:signal transduction histidine kinase
MLAPTPPARVVVHGRLPTVTAERVKLEQVLLNLIANALKHGGRPDLCVEVGVEDAGERWCFYVKDDGNGIPSEYHERIWGMFQTLRARDEVEGTGIGLSVVRKIVESQGGRAWVEGHEGQGATFRFTWPKW